MPSEYARVIPNIICHETGDVYRSQTAVAEDLGLSYHRVNYYFRTKQTPNPVRDIDGYTFDYTDEEPNP